MQEIALKESDISKLKKYPLDGIWSTESEILYYKRDKDWNTSTLIKKLYITENKKVQRKIDTITAIQDSELTEYKELVLPEDIIVVGGINSGFTIGEVIDSTNLALILKNKKIHDSVKIKILKKVGELLHKIQHQSQEFYFGDLQEFNLLVDKNGNIYVVDLDSSAVNRKTPLETKYIILDKKTHSVNKYKVNKAGRSYPSKNIDIFCYNTMVLNYLAGRQITNLSYNEYYEYIEYLKKIGIPKAMIDIYINHYTAKDNESVSDYLDKIPSIPRADYKVYQYLKQNKIFISKK